MTQARDVAAYIISQPRPKKAGLDMDFPDLLLKAVDAPYGPCADGPIEVAFSRLKSKGAH